MMRLIPIQFYLEYVEHCFDVPTPTPKNLK